MSAAKPPAPELHIVEPTLNGEAGHCMSLIRALTHAATQAECPRITVWAGRQVDRKGWPTHVNVQPHFIRKWRKLQALALYRRLLRLPGRILIATGGSADLVSLDWAARSLCMGRIADQKVNLFVHWLNIKPGKANLYKSIAARQPGLQILAPTESVTSFFRDCGFTARTVPYPLDELNNLSQASLPEQQFQHLLIPGSARMDKGFGLVVDLVEEMQRLGLDWPITVQTSLEHGHDKDQALRSALDRLASCGYPHLQMHDQAMDRSTYHAQFKGAIVIQPYQAASFRDRVSGVTLDALQAGAPIVVTADTWMARMVEGFGAGITTADLSPAALIKAIGIIMADHTGFTRRACGAAAEVRSMHSARTLIDAVLTAQE